MAFACDARFFYHNLQTKKELIENEIPTLGMIKALYSLVDSMRKYLSQLQTDQNSKGS